MNRSVQGISTFFAVILIFIVMAVSTAALFSIRFIVANNVESSLREVRNYVDNKKFDKALVEIDRMIVQKGVGHSELLVEKGKIFLALAWEQQNRDGWRAYGTDKNNWLHSSYGDSAEGYFEYVIRRDPRYLDAHYYLGVLYMQRGWYSEAETEFMEILKRDRNHSNARASLGALYTSMGRYDEAESELHRAYNNDPENSMISRNCYALYRYYKENPESSMVWANRFLNGEGGKPFEYYYIKQDLLDMMERYPEVELSEEKKWKEEKRFKPRKWGSIGR
jgi:tetratricopeptide (TPR) repeat protein